MYLLNDGKEYDKEYLYELMRDKRIFCSRNAKSIQKYFQEQDILPPKQGNYDWATLCIAYTFMKFNTTELLRENLIPAPDTGGLEIPHFGTCFQDKSKFWLAFLSYHLFALNPNKKVSKDDLYTFIQNLWHTGAVQLKQRYDELKIAYPDDWQCKKNFLRELAESAQSNLAQHQKSASQNVSGSLKNENDEKSPILDENSLNLLKNALRRANFDVENIELTYHGVRYDNYTVQFKEYPNGLENRMNAIRSELGLQYESDLRLERCQGRHAFEIKWLRDESTWQVLDKTAFQAALKQYQNESRDDLGVLPVCIGVDERGVVQFNDLVDAVHMVVSGSAGSGKSVFVRGLLWSLLQLTPPEKLALTILDPKQVDYGEFENVPHLQDGHFAVEVAEMLPILADLVVDMDMRYALMKNHDAKKLSELPENVRPKYRVVLIEEVADLLDVDKSAETHIVRLAQKARAAGIVLIVATQRPDSNTLSGRMRDNLPTRVAFKVPKSQSSTIILGETGAESLLGKGDHLLKWNGGKTEFLHGFNL